MSLINDALKKAQRQRSDPAGESLPPMPGGGTSPASRRVQKRGEPMRAQTILLLAGVTLFVLVLAVGGGFYFLRAGAHTPGAVNAGTTLAPVAIQPMPAAPSPGPTKPPASIVATPTTAPGSVAASAPVPPPATPVAAAVKTLPGVSANSSAATAAMASSPTSPPLIIAVITPTPAALVVIPSPTPTPAAAAPAAPAGPNAMVYSFLDTLHVGGIRSSGHESRVLMNEHVYRVGDVVDHLLGLKLTKVGTDTLTFVDLSGAVYIKNF